jgi:nitronate monooxygenase
VIRSRFTERFGLNYPLMSAPMSMHSSGRFAAAVSNAGALGTFGGTTGGGPDWLRKEIQLAREHTDRPFGVGFITHLFQVFPSLLDVALDERVPVVAFSFADPAPFVMKAKAVGATVICQVQTMRHAREAVAAGADILVAQGNEAGGHTGEMGLLPLLVNILDAHPDLPVVAAGGIATGRALAAVLAAGADGACVGTAFLATTECNDVSSTYKDAIVESDGEDTVYTRVMDIIQTRVMGIPPWPEGIAERSRREAMTDKWHGRESELLASIDSAVEEYQAIRAGGTIGVLMGQGAAPITSVRPVAQVVTSICNEAERLLQNSSRL